MTEIEFSREVGHLLKKNPHLESVTSAVSIVCSYYKLPVTRYKLFGLLVCSRSYSYKSAFESTSITRQRLRSILSMSYPKFDYRFELNYLIKHGYVNTHTKGRRRVYVLSPEFLSSINQGS